MKNTVNTVMRWQQNSSIIHTKNDVRICEEKKKKVWQVCMGVGVEEMKHTSR